MTVYGYIRTSTKLQKHSIEQQHQDILAAFPDAVLYSEQLSGYKARAANRPEFEQVVTQLEEGDILVVTMLDRLGRNIRAILENTWSIDDRGAHLVILNLGLEPVEIGDGMTLVMYALRAFEAQRESEKHSERMVRHHAYRKENGLKKMGRERAADPEKIQRLKSEGLTQRETAEALSCSLSTVRRSWNS